jgi:hypothetical protein
VPGPQANPWGDESRGEDQGDESEEKKS